MSETSDLIRNFNESIERSTKEINAWGSLLSTNARFQQQINAAMAEDLSSDEKLTKFIEKNADVAKNVTTGVLSFGKNISESAGSFMPLTKVVDLASSGISAIFRKMPLIGPIVSGFSEAGRAATNFMIESYEKAYSTFERASQSGVVTSFSTFEQSAAIMALSFSDYEKIIVKNSKDIALLGGGAINGRKMIETLGSSSETLRYEFAKLGLSTADSTEFQMSFLIQQQKINRGRLQMNDDTVAATGTYIKEIELLSRLTGQTRSQIDSARQDRMNNSVYRVMMESPKLPNEVKNVIPTFLDLVHTGKKDLDEGVISVLAASTEGTESANDNAKKLTNIFNSGGGDIYEIFRQFRTGEIDEIEAGKKYSEGLKKGVDALKKQTAVDPESRPEYRMFAAATDLYKKLANVTRESVEEEKLKIEKQTKETESSNAILANTRQDLYRTGNAIEKLSVSSSMVPAAMEVLSDTMYAMVDKAYEVAGGEQPQEIKDYRALRNATKARITAEEELLAAQQMADAGGDPYASAFGTPNQDAYEIQYKQDQINELKQQEQDLKNKRNNPPPASTSAQPTNPTPAQPKEATPVQSKQSQFVAPPANDRDGVSYERPVTSTGVAPHGAATGGIFRGSDSGYLAMLHGEEAVISNNDGESVTTNTNNVSKQALGSVASAMTNNSRSDNYSEMYERISGQLSKLTTLMSEQQNIQKKLLESLPA